MQYLFINHKSQGMTRPKVIIDIGPKESAPNLTYVALIQTRKLQDMIVKSYPKSRFDTATRTPANKLRVEFIKKYFNILNNFIDH